MKVLNVNVTLDPVAGGGTAERTFQLSRFLRDAGIECSVLTTDVGLTEQRKHELAGINLVALPCLSKRFFIPSRGILQVKQLIDDADVIHLMGHWTLLNVLVYFYVRRLRKPYVVCPAGALPIFGRSRLLKTLYNRLIGRRIVRNATRCLAITADEISHFRAYEVGEERVAVIPNGICPEDFLDRNETEFRRAHHLGNAPLILFVGRLNRIKGPDLLLEAFRHTNEFFPDYHLVFVGPDGGMQTTLERMTAEFSLEDRVHFLGYLGGAEKSRAYHAADLLVIPSRQEAMSIVVLEAGLTGTPVLLTDQCGFDEVADVGGGAVVAASVAGLQTGLKAMLGDRPGLGERGEKLKQFTAGRFSWNAIGARHLELFLSLGSDEASHPPAEAA